MNQIPSDAELLRFSSQCDPGKMQELATHLGMHRKWKVILFNYPQEIEIAIFLFFIEWKRKNSKGTFKVLADVLVKMNLSAHTLCYVSTKTYLNNSNFRKTKDFLNLYRSRLP